MQGISVTLFISLFTVSLCLACSVGKYNDLRGLNCTSKGLSINLFTLSVVTKLINVLRCHTLPLPRISTLWLISDWFIFLVFLSSFGINLLAFYHEWRALIGYVSHYLFCDR